MLSALSGRKTYIIAALLVIASGLYAQGYINEQTYRMVEGILLGGGLAFLRAGVAKS